MRRFVEERERLQAQMLRYSGKNIKRFLNVDHNAYEPGALPKKTKELLGLVASLVLRCEDCILYHLNQCHEQGVTTAELEESLAVALVVGGSITIPHVRRALDAWAGLGHPAPADKE
jgi:AhpD family alkylhydroperoxidase